MDIVDKRILYYLLKDGRISQRRIASLLNLTPASLNYRFKKLMDSGILRGFKLYINPNFLGKYNLYIAFKNYNDIDADWISFKLKCLEWLNVYGIYASNHDELKDKITFMSKELGEPVLSYFPVQSIFRPSNIDKMIIEVLKKDPRLPSSEIAKSLNISSKIIEKHIRYLRHKGLILVIPDIDLGKTDIVIFSMFSKNIDEITVVLQECKLWQFTDGYAGITVCYSDNMERARKIIAAARQIDKSADVMIIYDYLFK
ncbi:AsnC family transcriptional regulator [Sulfolobus sp. A20]|uniref:winged helix-turn-helix transcriptional regulator n=1 Tax=Sulfolobaceae TaxID=118883 RepID=UPI000845DF9D|nr:MULTISPECIES: winged helix-turn-helix transcriptional regulator [unclassified Sulfolobus]TRM74104.1 HTH domain-containing protein [Sulfolobus sp. E5]TRM75812.1 HTH domain-containing protein [Sulfolobus sp. A20-N-F8]TRM78622.1 HTH domain-containing protein [Sulfolobus sp. B5]TRM80743.1 HTH domain-containing protein [Sulfolobus sp. D5]TRM86963.1 HTH domain-containing protein [Sulfolobus sp. E3]TRM92120.1 HTH domain-containing protein [Sulfolobus sp. A20-N-G8]TRM99230.1 HTH domain-containing